MHSPVTGVFHVDPEKGWRGGQQQVAYLHKGLVARGIPSWVVCRPGFAFEAYLQAEGLPYLSVAMRNEADFMSGWQIARAAKERGVSILHLHSAHALSIGLWASLFDPGLKLIGVRRVALPIRKGRLSRYKYTSPRMTSHVAISDAIRRVMVADGIDPDRITTIHSGVDIHRMANEKPDADFRESNGIPGDHFVVGAVAALTVEKGYPTLLGAAAEILKTHKKVTFCALGEGGDRDALVDQARELGLGDHFKFMGFRKDVGAFLHLFDAFALASRMEGLGTSILDAQSIGLPVVASRVGGIPEIVEDGTSGLLVEAGDAMGFASQLLKLIEDPFLRETLSAGALDSVKRFSIDRTIEKNMALYESLSSS